MSQKIREEMLPRLALGADSGSCRYSDLSTQLVWHAGFIWDDDDHVTANFRRARGRLVGIEVASD